ncbi:MAG: flagellar hook-basal body complex protein FliE [Panacagrimonas sp.]
MSDIDVSSVLSQIRALKAQTGHLSKPVSLPTDAAAAAGPASFGRVMSAALDRVSLSQDTASQLQSRFQLGDANTDLASVMLASSRAHVEFKGLVEVRNRMVRAYQDIMNMPL